MENNSFVICGATNRIKEWLSLDDVRIWTQRDNPNCFISNRSEALHVYCDRVKYYEDIRCPSVVTEHRIPESKTELYTII